jgi:hypothetical protein
MIAFNTYFMLQSKRGLIFLLTLFLLNDASAQGPWAAGKGHGFAQLSFNTIHYNNVYDKDGTVQKVFRNNSDNTIQLFAEAGISKNLTAKLVLPFTIASYSNNLLSPGAGPQKASLAGIGNITAGIKYTRQFKHWLIAPSLDISLPASTPNAAKGLRNGYQNATVLPQVSAGISGKKWYAYTKLGYGITTNDYNDFVGINAEGGYKLLPSLWLSLVADLRITTAARGDFGKKERALYPNYAYTNFYVDDQEYFGIGIKAAYQFSKSKLGISAAAFGAAGGRNVAAALSLNGGVFYKF